jgi:hypothetical protein
MKEFVTEDVGGVIYVRERLPNGALIPVYDLDANDQPTIEHIYNPVLDDDWVGVIWYEHKAKRIRNIKRRGIPKSDVINIDPGKTKFSKKQAEVHATFHFPNGTTWTGGVAIPLPRRSNIRKRIQSEFPSLPLPEVRRRVRQYIWLWIKKELKEFYNIKLTEEQAEIFELPDEIRVNDP